MLKFQKKNERVLCSGIATLKTPKESLIGMLYMMVPALLVLGGYAIFDPAVFSKLMDSESLKTNAVLFIPFLAVLFVLAPPFCYAMSRMGYAFALTGAAINFGFGRTEEEGFWKIDLADIVSIEEIPQSPDVSKPGGPRNSIRIHLSPERKNLRHVGPHLDLHLKNAAELKEALEKALRNPVRTEAEGSSESAKAPKSGGLLKVLQSQFLGSPSDQWKNIAFAGFSMAAITGYFYNSSASADLWSTTSAKMESSTVDQVNHFDPIKFQILSEYKVSSKYVFEVDGKKIEGKDSRFISDKKAADLQASVKELRISYVKKFPDRSAIDRVGYQRNALFSIYCFLALGFSGLLIRWINEKGIRPQLLALAMFLFIINCARLLFLYFNP